MEANSGELCAVLVVEDNPGDAYLIRASLHQALRCSVVVVDHGDEALSLLRGASQAGRGCPSLLVLDLNLPALSGTEILRSMREQALCPAMPVIVCTSSTREKDLEAVRALGVAAVVTKTYELDRYAELGVVANRLLRSGIVRAD